jgi:hypothetical protein
MDRIMYIREGVNLQCRVHGLGWDYCNGNGKSPCMEINVFHEDTGRCMECTNRIDCLVKPQRCLTHVQWHVCDGPLAGVFYNPSYQTYGFMRNREILDAPTPPHDDEKKFKLLTGLTFADVVKKLYGV